MTSKLGGRKSKGEAITDNFNTVKRTIPTKKDLKSAKKELCNKCEVEPVYAKGMCKKCYYVSWDRAGNRKVNKPVASETDDIRSANQMLQDMRWVYRKVKGRDKLKNLVKEDDKQFVFMVKELMKIEASLLTAQIRKEGVDSPGQNGFFVVLKGLENDKNILSVVNDKTINLKQIENALNPSSIEVYQEESVNNKEPEQLFKSMVNIEEDNMEDEEDD